MRMREGPLGNLSFDQCGHQENFCEKSESFCNNVKSCGMISKLKGCDSLSLNYYHYHVWGFILSWACGFEEFGCSLHMYFLPLKYKLKSTMDVTLFFLSENPWCTFSRCIIFPIRPFMMHIDGCKVGLATGVSSYWTWSYYRKMVSVSLHRVSSYWTWPYCRKIVSISPCMNKRAAAAFYLASCNHWNLSATYQLGQISSWHVV